MADKMRNEGKDNVRERSQVMSKVRKRICILLIVAVAFSIFMQPGAVLADDAVENDEVQETSAEYSDDDSGGTEYEKGASSWRFQNGDNITNNDTSSGESAAPKARARAKAAFVPWSEVNGGFVNDQGEVIQGAIKKGIDVSEWQGKIDWEAVKASGIDFAIIRCGFGMDYTSQDDAYWERNVSECERLGIPYGVYLYSYATSENNVKSEAEHVLRLLKGHSPTYPVYYDLEDDGTVGQNTNATISKWAQTFCNTIEAAGYEAGIYANLNWWNNKLTDSALNAYDRWVAQYWHECEYKGTYRLWQCTSKGSVSGISGSVDINFEFNVPQNKKTVNYNPYRYSDVNKDTALMSGSGEEYSQLDTIPAGSRVLTYGYDKYSSTEAWYKVTYNGKTGYAKWGDVKLSYQPFSPNRTGKTTANLYMRSGVSTTYSKVAYIKSGSKLTLMGYYRMYGADWYKVKYNGKTGYVSSKYVVVDKNTTNYNPYRYADVKNATAMRTSSSPAYAAVLTIPKGARVLTYGYDKYSSSEAWYKVTYNGKTGYAKWGDVKLSYQAYSPKKAGKTTANLYMRSGVSALYSKVKYIKAGSKLTLHGYYRMYGPDWYKVTYGGKTGYVSSKYVNRLN